MSNDIKEMFTWIPCNEGKPTIPEGMKGVPVLMVKFSAKYEASNPLKGEYIMHGTYTDEGKYVVMYSEENPDAGMSDPITHWAYYPRTPQKIKAPQQMW